MSSSTTHHTTGSMLPFKMNMNIVSAVPQNTIAAAQRMMWGLSEKAMAVGSQHYLPPVQSALLSSPTVPSGIETIPTAPVLIKPPCGGGRMCNSTEAVVSGAARKSSSERVSMERYSGEENDGFQQTSLKSSGTYRIQPALSQHNTIEANMSSYGPALSRFIPETLQTRVELQPRGGASESAFAQDHYAPEEASKYDSFNRRQESTSWTTKEARQGMANFAVRNGGTEILTPMMRFGGTQGTFLGKPTPMAIPEKQQRP